MIQGALERGTLKPNGTIVEPTSGNTGIGLAVVSTCMGFKLILTMPESISDEPKALLRGFGAELTLTPAAKGMGGAVEEAQRLAATEGYVLLDQFSNPDNAEAHYRTQRVRESSRTPERWMPLLRSVGTGGTIYGDRALPARSTLPWWGCSLSSLRNRPSFRAVPQGRALLKALAPVSSPRCCIHSLLTEVLPIPGLEAIKMARRVMSGRRHFLRHFIRRQRRGGASSGERDRNGKESAL